MPKRKRSSLSPSDADSTSSSAVPADANRQRKLCTQRLAAAQKPLVAALRLGAGFERQKFSRRRKTAATKKDTTATTRLDAEYGILKSLDLAKLAEQHLKKTISKVKSLRDADGLPESCKETVKQTEGFGKEREAVWLNVTARLYKMPAVKKVVDQVVADLKIIIGVGGEPQGDERSTVTQGKDVRSKKARPQQNKDSDEASAAEDMSEEAFAAFDARIAAPSSGEEDSDDSLSDGHRPPSIEDSDQENVEELAGSEDESESEFGGFSQSDAISPPAEDKFSTDAEVLHEDSESDMDLAPRGKAKGVPEKSSKSTFLPSLSHANYFSGSESDASDLDIDVAPKKNRRGQRARQKIWEQKFGEKAKHVQKNDRNKGWDAKRGAVSEDRRNGKDRKSVSGSGRGPERSGGNMMELGAKKKQRDDSGPLHPSWQAAKAAKEKKMDVKPTGTKISFD